MKWSSPEAFGVLTHSKHNKPVSPWDEHRMRGICPTQRIN